MGGICDRADITLLLGEGRGESLRVTVCGAAGLFSGEGRAVIFGTAFGVPASLGEGRESILGAVLGVAGLLLCGDGAGEACLTALGVVGLFSRGEERAGSCFLLTDWRPDPLELCALPFILRFKEAREVGAELNTKSVDEDRASSPSLSSFRDIEALSSTVSPATLAALGVIAPSPRRLISTTFSLPPDAFGDRGPAVAEVVDAFGDSGPALAVVVEADAFGDSGPAVVVVVDVIDAFGDSGPAVVVVVEVVGAFGDRGPAVAVVADTFGESGPAVVVVAVAVEVEVEVLGESTLLLLRC